MFISLVSMLPLQLFNSGDAVSLTSTILDSSGAAVDIIGGIGKGIGSLFLLFVVFVYISNILDGGKFQVKMLLPLLIYLCVCNFKIVSGPVISFATTIQKACTDACHSNMQNQIDVISGGRASTGEVHGILGAFIAKASDVNKVSDAERDLINNLSDSAEIDDNNSAVSDNSKTSSFSFKGLVNNLYNTLRTWTNSIFEKVLGSFTFKPLSYMSYGVMGLLTVILQWICDLLSLAITAMGAVMVGIVVVFGPITWAFAIFPGNQRTIGAWAIRLCQFALYSPICALIESFFVSLLALFAGGMGSWGLESTGSMLMAGGLILGCIAALMSVPAIASMIIEGAQGAVTLSQGIMTASSIVQMGEGFRDKQMRDMVSSSNTGGGAAGNGGGAGPSSLPPGGGAGGGQPGGAH